MGVLLSDSPCQGDLDFSILLCFIVTFADLKLALEAELN